MLLDLFKIKNIHTSMRLMNFTAFCKAAFSNAANSTRYIIFASRSSNVLQEKKRKRDSNSRIISRIRTFASHRLLTTRLSGERAQRNTDASRERRRRTFVFLGVAARCNMHRECQHTSHTHHREMPELHVGGAMYSRISRTTGTSATRASCLTKSASSDDAHYYPFVPSSSREIDARFYQHE